MCYTCVTGISNRLKRVAVWLPSSKPLKFRIMTKRQILRSSTIIVLGILQLVPCLLILSSTIISVLGILYILFLLYFWSSTKIGNGFFKNFVRENERLEKILLKPSSES
nr:MAG TPA: hypothetical protein [Caudoviricetes sp.]